MQKNENEIVFGINGRYGIIIHRNHLSTHKISPHTFARISDDEMCVRLHVQPYMFLLWLFFVFLLAIYSLCLQASWLRTMWFAVIWSIWSYLVDAFFDTTDDGGGSGGAIYVQYLLNLFRFIFPGKRYACAMVLRYTVTQNQVFIHHLYLFAHNISPLRCKWEYISLYFES